MKAVLLTIPPGMRVKRDNETAVLSHIPHTICKGVYSCFVLKVNEMFELLRLFE